MKTKSEIRINLKSQNQSLWQSIRQAPHPVHHWGCWDSHRGMIIQAVYQIIITCVEIYLSSRCIKAIRQQRMKRVMCEKSFGTWSTRIVRHAQARTIMAVNQVPSWTDIRNQPRSHAPDDQWQPVIPVCATVPFLWTGHAPCKRLVETQSRKRLAPASCTTEELLDNC